MLWLSMIIPTLAFIVLMLVPKWRKCVVWWEGVLLFLPPLIMVPLFSSMGEASVTNDIEYWGAYVTKANHYEAWDEKVSCRHPKFCTRTVTKRDSKGKSYTTTETYQCGWMHAYDVDHHPERWSANVSDGSSFSINKSTYLKWKNLWGNEKFVDMKRNYYSYDGDSYTSRFDDKDAHLQPRITKHTYENRIQVSSSVFNFAEVDDPSGLYDYSDGYSAILGDCVNKKEANQILTVANCRLGSSRQLRLWMLCFKGGSVETGMLQERYWKGGNKNELVVCIGINSDNAVDWVYPFTWSEVDIMKPNIRNGILDLGEFDAVKAASIIVNEAKANWRRKEFKDFEYVKVDLPIWTYWVTFIVTIIVTLGVSLFVVSNEIY